MELGEMVQKPGEWNDSLQSHRYPWAATARLRLCWASPVRREAAVIPADVEEQSHMFEWFMAPRGAAAITVLWTAALVGKRRLRQSVRWQEMMSQMWERGAWGLWECLQEVTGFSHQPGPSSLLLSALGGAPSCSFICLASFSTACSQPAFCSACC